jgi:hypothetical protein
MQDCVIGCFSGYGWDEVKIWARSLGASGFAGHKVALVRDPAPGVFDALIAERFDVMDFSPTPAAASPYVERFRQLYRYLLDRRRQGLLYRWVVATDVRDVCFQRNPLEFLARLDPPRLVLSPEGLTYRHAAWNAGNMVDAFGPDTLEALADAAPNNVGVLAAPHRTLEGLALLIAHLTRAATADVADQAAFNLLTEGLATALWVHRAGSAEPWACQVGVMADPGRIDRNRPHLLGPEPLWRDGLVTTASGEPYAIVHQYDRVPAWQAAVTARFGW